VYACGTVDPIFYQIYKDLPRLGPGDEASTRRAWSMLAGLPSSPRILDVGCGPGMQSLLLARLGGGTLVAVDNHAPYLDELRRRAEREGLSDQVSCRTADMADLPFDAGSFDLVWSEGAVYIMGFQNGLESWRTLLAGRGCLAVTEATWLRDDAPEPCRSFWDEGYPAMTDVAGNLATVEACGYESLGHFALPDSAWMDDYYTPLEARLPQLEQRFRDNPTALEYIEEARAEIEFFRQYSPYYGYVFYVMRRSD